MQRFGSTRAFSRFSHYIQDSDPLSELATVSRYASIVVVDAMTPDRTPLSCTCVWCLQGAFLPQRALVLAPNCRKNTRII